MDAELQKLIDAARGGNPKSFHALVEALRKNGGVPAAVLRELFGADDSPIRRAALVAAKGRFVADPSLVPLAASMAKDPDPGVRRQLAEILESETAAAFDDAVDVLLDDDDDTVRAAAPRAARKRPRAEAALLALLDSEHEHAWTVRKATALALDGHASEAAFLPLLRAIAHDEIAQVAQAAAVALESIFKAVGTPPLPRVDVQMLEAAQAKIVPIARRCRLLGAWLEQKLSTEVDVKKLRELGADLTMEAEQGKLPRAFGADATCEELRKVLTASGGPRGAVLLGEPGTGKTAIVNELVHRLRADGWRVIRFSPVEVLAGTKYLGEWQTKLNEVMKAVKAPRKVILYCNNLEELAEAGRTSVSDINFATAMAPRIEAGEIAILGESTPEGFRSGLGAIPSLRRLFHAIEVKETETAQTRRILESIVRDAKADVPGPVLDRLVELADFYLSTVAQPGRSAGLLRRVIEACAEKKEIQIADVLATLSASTGVPRDLLDDAVALDLASVRGFFEQRVMGQPEAIDAIADVVSLVKAGLTDPGKPFGVLFFVGPTGVGKTELARALAEYLFGDAKRMVRFDMSEFATYDAYERLIGRGDRPGLLTSAVRERPFSVLLMDEIEKAHANVFDLCLQLFDAGRLTDAKGRTADFRRTIIVLTSNVGSRIRDEAGLGFGGEKRGTPSQDEVMRELHRFFRPEFLNRLDRVVYFRPLAVETAEKIARREVAKVIERSGIARRGLAVDVDPAALALLLREGYSPTFGARPLKRTVERLVLLPVARAIATGGVPSGSALRLVARGDRVDVEVAVELATVDLPAAGERRIEERAAKLATRAAALEAAAGPLAERKEELLAASGAKNFWNDAAAARRILDEVHRLDGVLSALDRLMVDAAAQVERAHRAARMAPKDLVRANERLDALEAEASRVAFLLSCRDARDLGDAFVLLTLVKSTGDGLDAVEKLANMYVGLARRRGLAVEVLSDRRGGDPQEDTIALAIGGAGAYATLAGEAGLHQVLLGRTEGRAPREDRDVVRVDVLAAPTEETDVPKTELKVETKTLKGVRGRLLEKPTVEVSLLHVPTLASVRAWTTGAKDAAVEKLLPLLRARASDAPDADRPITGVGAPVVRRYTLGPSPLVRDPRSGRSTGRLSQVLEGDLDAFLALPREATG